MKMATTGSQDAWMMWVMASPCQLPLYSKASMLQSHATISWALQVINVSGHRIGTAEVESALVRHKVTDLLLRASTYLHNAVFYPAASHGL